MKKILVSLMLLAGIMFTATPAFSSESWYFVDLMSIYGDMTMVPDYASGDMNLGMTFLGVGFGARFGLIGMTMMKLNMLPATFGGNTDGLGLPLFPIWLTIPLITWDAFGNSGLQSGLFLTAELSWLGISDYDYYIKGRLELDVTPFTVLYADANFYYNPDVSESFNVSVGAMLRLGTFFAETDSGKSYNDNSYNRKSYDDDDSSSSDGDFTTPQRKDDLVYTICRTKLKSKSDSTWAKLLLAGFQYTYKNADSGDTLGVAFAFKDGSSQLYMVKYTDYKKMLNKTITIEEFTDRIRVKSLDD